MARVACFSASSLMPCSLPGLCRCPSPAWDTMLDQIQSFNAYSASLPYLARLARGAQHVREDSTGSGRARAPESVCCFISKLNRETV